MKVDRPAEEKPNRYSITAVEKALDVLEALSEHDSLNLLELVDILKQPKSSLFRTILTLESRGYIARSEDTGKYCLGYKHLVLTKKLLENSSLRSCAVQEMKLLVDKYGDTVNLGVIDDNHVLYVEIIEGTHSLRMNESVGSTGPLHATAIGKCMLAYLPDSEVSRLIEQLELAPVTPNTITDRDRLRAELQRIKETGYAVDRQEAVQGAKCVAAPIFNIKGRIEGAISISGALHRFPDDKIPDIARDVRTAARQASLKLGFTDYPEIQ